MPFDPARMLSRRTALGLSQYQLEDKTGIARTMLSSWEAGRHAPAVKALEALADALEVSTDWLLAREPVKAAKPVSAARDVDRPSTLEEAQGLAEAQGKTYVEHRGRAYRLRRDGWEPV